MGSNNSLTIDKHKTVRGGESRLISVTVMSRGITSRGWTQIPMGFNFSPGQPVACGPHLHENELLDILNHFKVAPHWALTLGDFLLGWCFTDMWGQSLVPVRVMTASVCSHLITRGLSQHRAVMGVFFKSFFHKIFFFKVLCLKTTLCG